MGLFSRKPATATAPVATVAPVATTAPVAQVPNISGDYVIDASHSRLGFSARHAMVTKVRGQFDAFEGTAHVDAVTPANSSVSVTIQAASVTTGNEQRDGHLKTPDFFDIANHPQITFVSTSITSDGDRWDITGDLTINGVTKPVSIPFEPTGTAVDPYGNTRVGFEGATTIDRTDWNLSFNAALETGGVLVSEKITLEFDISAIAQVPARV